MEAKEYNEIYNVVADQNFPEGITKNQKDVLRNKAKKFVIRDGLLYYCDKKRGERQVSAVGRGVHVCKLFRFWCLACKRMLTAM